MLTTIKAMLLPSGMLSFEEALVLDHPTPVLVTLLEESTGPKAAAPSANPEPATDPLDWPLSSTERAIWEELPSFRAEHPVRFAALKLDS